MPSLPDDVLAGGVIRSTDMNAILAALRLIYGDVQNISITYDVLITDFAIMVNDDGGNVSINLPTDDRAGKLYLIQKVVDNSNHVIVNAFSGEAINGNPSIQIDNWLDNIILIGTGNNSWIILSKIGTPH